ncbi:DUF3253 domain-containing protein [Mucilaginibacter sp.]|uniref:DUF3253 domain-containing protein n=1 Tax=Mucilaginibacter sp. TaxID=1882438 RepID=UPI003B001D52
MDIKKAILQQATERGADKTICPSEVARKLFPENWRTQMQIVRDAAFDLQAQNKIQILQKGKTVDPKITKGPIRIRIITEKTDLHNH